MAEPVLDRRVPVEEYLASEPTSPVKREYVHGRVYALAGASDRHVRLVTNVVGLLWLSARGTGCRVYASDMKLRVGPDRFYYPDVMVVCDPGDTDPYYKTRPCFLVEVLSPATEATDRREKLVAYQEIPTLRGYLLLDSEAVGGEYYRKDEDGRWWRTELSPHSLVRVDCPATTLDLQEVYEGL